MTCAGRLHSGERFRRQPGTPEIGVYDDTRGVDGGPKIGPARGRNGFGKTCHKAVPFKVRKPHQLTSLDVAA